FSPFPNKSAFEMAHWYFNGGNKKSVKEFNELITMLKDPTFNAHDTANANWSRIIDSFQQHFQDNSFPEADSSGWFDDAGWNTTPISIPVPFHKAMKNSGIEQKVVGTLHHCKILSILEEKVRSPSDGPHFHYHPYKFGIAGAPRNIHVYGEMYTSDAFLKAHKELQQSPPIVGCKREHVVASLMFWSDATQLTQFGSAKLWPCYMFFRNESKYRCSKTSLDLCKHVAYFDTISDDFKDYLRARSGGKLPPSDFFTHCNQEVFQAQWALLLNEELVEAMKNGIVLMCHDGVERRFYPRIFTYSTDYPEQVIIATMKQNGTYPCPRCLILNTGLQNMGTPEDMAFQCANQHRNDEQYRQMLADAHKEIKMGFSITGDKVLDHMNSRSMVPVKNAFHSRLADLNFNIFPCLVVNLLHEFEIGVWKSSFIHLIQLLYALNKAGISDLDLWYRTIDPFGKETIQAFGLNASEMRRKAARDYKDLLQCLIPIVDSLLPAPHDEIVLELLRLLCEWHALTKLHLHNKFTVKMLETTTIQLGSQFWLFQQEMCSKVATMELPREYEAPTNSAERAQDSGNGAVGTTRRVKTFNLTTVKYHSLGDYADSIIEFGTTDSITSEIGEKSHRNPKTWYRRTNKRGYRWQIALVEQRRARLKRLKEKSDQELHKPVKLDHPTEFYYNITGSFVRTNTSIIDPALTNVIPKLKGHLLPHILRKLAPGLYLKPQVKAPLSMKEDWVKVIIHKNRLCHHQLLRLRYTTYDVRRDEDIIHLRTGRSNIMVLNTDYDPGALLPLYRYGRVIRIFSADVMYVGALADKSHCYEAHRLDILWVCWFGNVPSKPSGVQYPLERIQFLPLSSDDAFGFIDPTLVIRAAHIIPNFSAGPCEETASKKSAWTADKKDWQSYCINKYIDRNMFMRYHSDVAIGHLAYRSKHPQFSTAHVKRGGLQPTTISKVPATTITPPILPNIDKDESNDNDDFGPGPELEESEDEL
ncbi:hypothetical protein FA15DRAFT_599618, partial [Coprinopsis marcescibilis]